MPLIIDNTAHVVQAFPDVTLIQHDHGSGSFFGVEFPDNEASPIIVDEAELAGEAFTGTSASFVLAQVQDLQALPDNWDGYGAPRIGSDVANSATKLVQIVSKSIPITPSVVPTTTGGVQLEWSVAGRSLELEVVSATDVEFLRYAPNDGIEDEGVFPLMQPTGMLKLAELLGWLERGEWHAG